MHTPDRQCPRGGGPLEEPAGLQPEDEGAHQGKEERPTEKVTALVSLAALFDESIGHRSLPLENGHALLFFWQGNAIRGEPCALGFDNSLYGCSVKGQCGANPLAYKGSDTFHKAGEGLLIAGIVGDDRRLPPVLTGLWLLGEGHEGEDADQGETLGAQKAQLARAVGVEVPDARPEAIDEPGFLDPALDGALDSVLVPDKIVRAEQGRGVLAGRRLKCLICTKIPFHDVLPALAATIPKAIEYTP